MKNLIDSFSGNIVPDKTSSTCASGPLDICAHDSVKYNTLNIAANRTSNKKGWSLDDLYEQSAITVDTQIVQHAQPTRLSINAHDATEFLCYTNVESYVTAAINNIVDNYPFGLTGSATFVMYDDASRMIGSLSSLYNPKSHSLQTTGAGRYDLVGYCIS